MAQANKRGAKAAAAWRLVLLGAMLAGGAQLVRQQREIDALQRRLDERAPAPPAPAAVSWSSPASLAQAAPRAIEMSAAAQDVRHEAQQHYLSGVIFYQAGDYEKARAEWRSALRDDPSNEDAEAGLQRLDAAYSGR